MSSTGFNFLNVLIVLVPMLLGVAFMTIIERKVLAAMQRRVGPDTLGIYGIAQPFALGLLLLSILYLLVHRRNLRFGALNFSWAFGP